MKESICPHCQFVIIDNSEEFILCPKCDEEFENMQIKMKKQIEFLASNPNAMELFNNGYIGAKQ